MALSDSGNHAPATSGTYDYNATPNVGATLSLGASYTDPVFSESVRRLTNLGASAASTQNYSYHNFNADGTKAFNYNLGQLDIISTVDGSTTWSNQPTGGNITEMRWHMTDPDKYFYFSTTNLVQRNLAAQTNTTIKTFPATLESMGGTANYSDKTSRYHLIQYSGLVHLWDSQTDTTYTGTVTPDNWTGITPSGNYIVSQAGTGTNPNQLHSSYLVNHGTQTIGSAIQYWGIQSGDHAGLISCSDGNDYAMMVENQSSGSVYLTRLSQSNAGQTQAQQIRRTRPPDNNPVNDAPIIPITFFVSDGHFSPVSVGANQDWVFYSSEYPSDTFGTAVGAWQAFKQEIIACNVLTGELKRLAHHRSRGDYGFYWDQPRVTCSPTGNWVMWASNMNDSTPSGYSDQYGIENPLGASGGGAAAQRLRSGSVF